MRLLRIAASGRRRAVHTHTSWGAATIVSVFCFVVVVVVLMLRTQHSAMRWRVGSLVCYGKNNGAAQFKYAEPNLLAKPRTEHPLLHDNENKVSLL